MQPLITPNSTRIMEIREGNIVNEVTEGIIIQQVNAQGVMGSGVAKDIREKWPQVFDEYIKAVGQPYTQKENGRLLLGTMIPVKVDANLWVCNIVGQQFFGREPGKQPGGRYTSYDALADGMKKVCAFALENPIISADLKWADRNELHFPLMGCGLGGGDWGIVSGIIKSVASHFETTLWLLPGTTDTVLNA